MLDWLPMEAVVKESLRMWGFSFLQDTPCGVEASPL